MILEKGPEETGRTPLQTDIGRAFGRNRGKLLLASAIALLTVTVDVLLSWKYKPSYAVRGMVPLVAIALYVWLSAADPGTLGLRLHPRQGYAYWVRMTALIGGGMGVLLILVFGTWYLLVGPPPVYRTAPEDFYRVFVHACVGAPLVEEATYRLVLCVPLVRLLGPWGGIAASGALFAALHVVYGNPSPENLLGGFVLAWAFVKSGSLVVPLLWHSLGNLVALLGQLVAWHVV